MAATPDTFVKTIELDVQITRDNRLFIFQDSFFRSCGVSGHHTIHDAAIGKFPICNLTFGQLEKLYRQDYVSHSVSLEESTDKCACFRKWVTQTHAVPEEAFDVRLRTLRQTCEVLTAGVGMPVELNYPPPDIYHGGIPYPEKNHYVSLVIEELLTVDQNKDRKIAFLTFDSRRSAPRLNSKRRLKHPPHSQPFSSLYNMPPY